MGRAPAGAALRVSAFAGLKPPRCREAAPSPTHGGVAYSEPRWWLHTRFSGCACTFHPIFFPIRETLGSRSMLEIYLLHSLQG